ncbi:unnamed protein product [Symbiodinium sp. CCMP2592]|nr:unnamed protein product [Symbiodinium sp. CCMP2592]
MDIVPFVAATGDSDGQRTEAAANQYFLQLLQENNQVNIFLNDPSIQQALELRAERRHQFVLDNIYAEANSYIAHLEATADANHRQQLAFVRESTMVLAQLTRTQQECRDERSMAMRFDTHRSELEAAAHALTAGHRQHEYHLAELRTSFGENRNELIEYLGFEFEEKLQWEENECQFRLTSEEQQYDSLVDDLQDRNAELIAELFAEIAAVNDAARRILTFDGEVRVNSTNAEGIAAELAQIIYDSRRSAEGQTRETERLAEQNRQAAARNRPSQTGRGRAAEPVYRGYTQAQWDEYYRQQRRGQYTQAEWDAWNRTHGR